ncbi:MAG: glycosyltransferase, partial [Flavobacteriaceae bacterium]|nr:glycosyltransferase [Flavobacteriaceae bacterium]
LNNPDIYLICTGHPTEFYTNNIKPFIEKQGLTDKIKFVGIVSDEELFELYHKCSAVVVPTLYEAGSFPLVESILMGIPVVCSNVTSLPETIGDGQFVFDPIDISDIADKINKIWSDDIYRIENMALLKIQALKLTNNNAANNINIIYEAICSKQ